MWDRCAAGHTGACLVFDRAALLSDPTESPPILDGTRTIWGSVDYLDGPLQLPVDGGYCESVEQLRAVLADDESYERALHQQHQSGQSHTRGRDSSSGPVPPGSQAGRLLITGGATQ